MGYYHLVTHFLPGTLRLKPSVHLKFQAWDLAVVLEGLSLAPFETLDSISEKLLELKMAFLLTLTSLKKVGDL